MLRNSFSFVTQIYFIIICKADYYNFFNGLFYSLEQPSKK
jgi:hypothetical protein